MEKHSTLLYVGFFFLVLLVIFSFGMATLGIAGFIEDIKTTTNIAVGVSCLGAVAFIMGYYVGTVTMPPPKLKFGWGQAIAFIWMLLIIILLVLVIRNFHTSIGSFLLAITNYHWAGLVFAQVSNRYQALKKS